MMMMMISKREGEQIWTGTKSEYSCSMALQ